jgi:hypothetical protein
VVAGREYKGIHLAMEYLHGNTKSLLDSGDVSDSWLSKNNGKLMNAKGKVC